MIERVRGDDYKIQMKDKTRTYHANMLKRYFERVEIDTKTNQETIYELNAVVVETKDDKNEDETCTRNNKQKLTKT